MNQTLFALDRVSFQRGAKVIFSDVTMTLERGDRLALLGSNGTGKTTLLQMMVGLNKPFTGNLIAFDQERVSESDFRTVRQKVGLLFQDSDDQLFCPTVLEDVAFGPLNLGKSDAEARDIALSTLADLGLSDLSDCITHRLSGGQKRLVALATVLAMSPEVLLLDEPTNALDDDSKERLLSLLASLDMTMIIVSHDQTVIERLANRAMIMREGSLVDAVMHRHPHQHSHSHLHIHAKSDLSHHDPETHTDHHLAD
ncbi:energy-coupling factor ABC transporter ATP-binding protein [Litoribrevibacter albus]|uniref:Cobalt ABC transporter ATP-binding protein n=1 Tax=Litoribrevibacter albus TaxID=1473156 RepID=A0AA37S900_9GAMM|nr:ABC transporter ATP-binding protein [Litoribrevibacter albus]GLQ30803.1 cobalt ABC transporter ATP-binding protein [Litoribrevibacter albus]